ncbi:MAG: terpene cyclase/mutase family protein [Pirellulales bacterium]|nr:terpene cyclase/mutase family protein [Pirellulales bacterium]
MHRRPAACLAVLVSSLFASASSAVDPTDGRAAASQPARASVLVDRGIAYLAGVQDEDGAFSRGAGPAVTALVATAMLENGRTTSDPVVARALKFVEAHVRPDGGVYAEGSKYRNYETCLAIRCFTAANKEGKYNDLIRRAEAYVKEAQWDEGEGYDKSSEYYGGAGYGSHNRPDLSNTSFLADALQAVGEGPDDPAVRRMLVFVSRCQNLESEHNQSKFPALNPDGGFYYTIAAGGSSQAGTTANGGLRSYGSMTYAGLKSMIFAGVDKDDPRVKAAVDWARQHYTLEENPGIGDAGLYYYFHTFAKALDAIGESRVTDGEGVEHDWRQELVDALAARQQEDGSWVNANPRWLEGDPSLVTGYALLALSYCHE